MSNIASVMRVFWQHVRPYRLRAFVVLFSIAAATLADAVFPWFLKRLFDLMETNEPSAATLTPLVHVLLGILGLHAISWTFWRVVGFTNDRFQPPIMSDLEQSAFRYLLGHSHRFFADHFAGSLVRKVGRLSRGFERFADEMQYRLLPTIIILVASVVGLYLRFPLLSVLFVAWTAAYLFMNFLAAKWALAADIRRAELESETGGALADAMTNAATIKFFSGQSYEGERFQEVMGRWSRANTVSWDRHEIIWSAGGALMIGIEILLMYLGLLYWSRGLLTLGDLALIQTYLVLVFGKLWEISRSFRHVFEACADAKEMVEIMDTPHEVRDAKRATAIQVSKGAIAFVDVGFSYHKTRRVLQHFDLTVKHGEKIALVGSSGAGKSTVVKLLMRFYDLDEGKILIDGQDIAKATQESVWDAVALVPQDPVLFHRTLMENIRYGRREASDEEVTEAAKKARCHEFIAELPNGYDTYVGERGVKLSGGERQRVAIARAILKNAPILVLDEATSSLDSESEALIQDALRTLMREKTTIVIAHRLSTIMQMDRIIVMEEGRITDTGTHASLLKKKGIYQKLWEIQAGGFLGEDE